MSKVTCGVTMSLDGFVASNNMTLEKPFGHITPDVLMRWMFDEKEKHKDEIEALTAAGAYIMGSNMFGPEDIRMTNSWKGWWGDNPPYHAPVFVLSHTQRNPVSMDGGTTFTFVTDGIKSALDKARSVAGTKDIAIAGGADVINQYLRAGLINELWLHIAPITIGDGHVNTFYFCYTKLMQDQQVYSELFDKICSLFEGYMREKRANTQPQKLIDQITDNPDYIFDPKDNIVREGLVEHVGFLPILATTIYPYVKSNDIDLGQALIMLAIHDIGEIITGEIITFLKKDTETEKEQVAAIKLLDPYFHNLYNLVENPSTPTSRFAKSMDKTVADFIDYICPIDVTFKRYRDQLNLNSAADIISTKRKHKSDYFTWNPFLSGFFEFTLDKTKEKLTK